MPSPLSQIQIGAPGNNFNRAADALGNEVHPRQSSATVEKLTARQRHFNRGEKAGARTPKRAMTEFMRMADPRRWVHGAFRASAWIARHLQAITVFFTLARLVTGKRIYRNVRNLASVK